MKLFLCSNFIIAFFLLPPFINASNDIFSPRIVGGSEVGPNLYSWFVRAIKPNSSWWGCGGTLISKEFILTAAHCGFTIRSGFQIGALCSPYGPVSNRNCHQEVEKIWTKQVFDHPNYSSKYYENDFSLIQLKEPSTIDPVALDQWNISDSFEGGEVLTTIGFGRVGENKPAATHLMHVNISYITNEECSSVLTRPVPDSQMCAGETINGGKDACNGDSGGPLLYSGILVGVTSWGIGCGTTKPAGYSRIADQFEWIKDIVCTHHTPESAPPFCASNEATPELPSISPSNRPSSTPSHRPSDRPSNNPNIIPTPTSPIESPSINPSINPSTLPSSSPVIFKCPPDKKLGAKFWDGTYRQKKNGKWKIGKKNCKWLQKQPQKEQNKKCAMTEGKGKWKPARKVCTGTCNSCREVLS